MMRPAIPPEAQGRLAGVMAGSMKGFQIPAAMGFSGRSGQVYVPAGYKANTPVAFMIFHDGTSLDGSEAISIVTDNLFFEKKMPMMVAIFIPPVDRSREYDTVNDNFSKYLTTNALPAVEALNIKLTTDPEASGACGHSSGGILAFTMAWFEPERYRRVLSFSGSYTTLQNPGGGLYDMLVRTTMPLKPIRVAMTAGTNDLLAPRWTQANETMGAALMAAGYHYRYILISGGTHDQASSRPWVADLLTWLWRGYPVSGPTR
jgi:enterochelin esterase family protein